MENNDFHAEFNLCGLSLNGKASQTEISCGEGRDAGSIPDPAAPKKYKKHFYLI
tara:strand:+ start:124 stop:285 length:162 start_codon:yes stop_codon:yes gene_type:complete